MIDITSWFKINFVENNGMAYGMTFFNKLVLSVFRIIAITVIGIYLARVIKKGMRLGYIICLSMVLAGAMGNMIDSMFYGLIFNYAPFLYGKVVDMLYFPLIDTTLPANFPIWGGRHIIFFRPIFNIADSCITCGAFYLLLFQWKFFAKAEQSKNSEISENTENNS